MSVNDHGNAPHEYRERSTFCFRGTILLFTALIASACATSSTDVSPLAGYLNNPARTNYWPNSSVTAGNASSLAVRWTIAARGTISAQAVVANGMIYWGDWSGEEHETTSSGRTVWSTFVGTSPKPAGCPYPLGNLGVTSTPVVGKVDGRPRLWVGGGGGTLYSLNATTGAVVWKTNLGAPPLNVLWSSPLLYDGSIYEGVASWNDCPKVVYGKIFRLSATTGAVQSVFSPQPAGCVGGGIWSSPTVDTAAGALYVTNGNDDCKSPVQDSIFRLDAKTMAVEAHWQPPASALAVVTDADFGATPTLFEANVRHRLVPMVGAESKDGRYYAFERNNISAGPVWDFVAESNASIYTPACEDLNTISSSAWLGVGSALLVAGIQASGSQCVGTLSALDPASGHVLWQTSLAGPVFGAVTAAKGIVAVGAGSTLEVLSSATGKVLFSYPEPHVRPDTGNGYNQPYWFWAPPTLSPSGLFIGNQDGTLIAMAPPGT